MPPPPNTCDSLRALTVRPGLNGSWVLLEFDGQLIASRIDRTLAPPLRDMPAIMRGAAAGGRAIGDLRPLVADVRDGR